MSSNSNNRHELLERNVGLLAIFIVFAISWGALVEITPLIFQKQTTEEVQNLKPYTALQLEGRDITSVKVVTFVTARWCAHSVLKPSVMAITLWQVKVFGNTHFYGALSVLVLT